VIPCRQPDRALAALRAQVAAQDDFALTALSEVVALSGSLVLGLATLDGHLAPDTAWQLSRIDEDWQVEHWGIDDAAAAATAEKRAAFLNAHRFHRLARSGG
jgi:chaperone required for assembly of F1-ATPase